jgi:hypothetical protein
VFEVQGLRFTETGFRGCAFARASAEAPEGSSIDEVGERHRTWLRSLFVDLANDAGARNPEQLAQQLLLLYDGAGISASMDHDPSAAEAARSVVAALVDAALPERTQHRKIARG